ncbi:winged helix-turn-helix transcriptional regulator [Nonomuraea sp. NPDC050663]|uniref:winged helix-turn-helix transcriptional regulator n=1 Tax=Nonomuraea sp. NPDC050663 TaxID=3364370 RepID=UPI0037B50B7F
MCIAKETLDRLGDKWSVAVMHELSSGTRRFMELRRALPAISKRMLTATLRALEEDGLLERTVHPTVPPRVDYELTRLGHSLLESAWTVMNWGESHTSEIELARQRFAERAQHAV